MTGPDLLVPVGVVLAVAVVALGWYLLFCARRLDRLHRRVEGAAVALDDQLLRRAQAALELTATGTLDPASALLVAGAAATALEAGEGRAAQLALDPFSGSRLEALSEERESAESDLSRALRATLDPLPDDHPARTDHLLDQLGALGHRVALARRFHNDAVSHATALRRKRLVRWARLAGSAPRPRTVDFDDAPFRAAPQDGPRTGLPSVP